MALPPARRALGGRHRLALDPRRHFAGEHFRDRPKPQRNDGRRTTMYRLYWSPGSASMAVHAALEETGADYALERVDLSRSRELAYLRLNPTGRVPTLAVGEG